MRILFFLIFCKLSTILSVSVDNIAALKSTVILLQEGEKRNIPLSQYIKGKNLKINIENSEML